MLVCNMNCNQIQASLFPLHDSTQDAFKQMYKRAVDPGVQTYFMLGSINVCKSKLRHGKISVACVFVFFLHSSVHIYMQQSSFHCRHLTICILSLPAPQTFKELLKLSSTCTFPVCLYGRQSEMSSFRRGSSALIGENNVIFFQMKKKKKSESCYAVDSVHPLCPST